jgi:hypothetical protein
LGGAYDPFFSTLLRQQRAAFVKDYVAKFYTEKELYGTFHDLVYTYSDTQFKQVQRISSEQNPKNHHFAPDEKPIFEWFDGLQGARTSGSRLYHPLLFQGSQEEQRLDRLLGYFDVIGYYYVNGFLEIGDVVGSLGYHLAVIADRDVIQEYLKIARTKWRDLPYEREMNAAVPFVYLTHLLRAVKSYNALNTQKINQLLNDPPS